MPSLRSLLASLRLPAILVGLATAAFFAGLVLVSVLPNIGLVRLVAILCGGGVLIVLAVGALRDSDPLRRVLLVVLLLLADWSVGVQAEFRGKAIVVIAIAGLVALTPFNYRTLGLSAQFLLGLGALAVVSSLWSADRLQSFVLALALFGAIVMIPRLLAAFPDEESLLRVVFWVLFALLAASVVVYAVAPGIGTSGREFFGPFPRMSGVLGHPNRVARLSGVLFVLLVALRRRSVLPHWAMLAGWTVVASTLFLAQSRTVFITLAIALIFMSWARRGAANTPVLLATVIVATVALSAMPSVVDDVLANSTRSDQGASVLDEGRGPLWSEVIDRSLDRPLVGHGYAQPSEGDEFVSYGLASRPWVTRKPHNLALYVFYTMGLVGSALFFAAIILYIARSRRQPVDYADGWFAFILASGMTSSLVGNGGPSAMTIMLIVALSARSAPWYRSPARRPGVNVVATSR